MQSNTESERKCDHAVNVRKVILFEFSKRIRGEIRDKKVTCAKSVEAILLLRRDLKTYFMEKREKVVLNFEKVLILGLGKSLYKKLRKVINKIESEKEIELDSVHAFLERLSSVTFYRYTEAYFDFINQSLDRYIDKLRDDFKKGSIYSKSEIDSFFKSYNIPEDFCYRVSKPRFLIDLGKDIENICNNRNTCFVNCSAQAVKVKHFNELDVKRIRDFCKQEDWDFLEFFGLIANLFSSLDMYLAWKFFSSKLNPKDSMEDCIEDFKYSFCTDNKASVSTFEYYLDYHLRKKVSEVNSFSQKKSLTISRSFTASPPKRGVDTKTISQSFAAGSSSLLDWTLGENSSGIALSNEEEEVWLQDFGTSEEATNEEEEVEEEVCLQDFVISGEATNEEEGVCLQDFVISEEATNEEQEVGLQDFGTSEEATNEEEEVWLQDFGTSEEATNEEEEVGLQDFGTSEEATNEEEEVWLQDFGTSEEAANEEQEVWLQDFGTSEEATNEEKEVWLQDFGTSEEATNEEEGVCLQDFGTSEEATKFSPSSIYRGSSPDTGLRPSAQVLLPEGSQFGLFGSVSCSSKDDSIGSIAVVRKKRKALQVVEEIKCEFDAVVKGIKAEFDQKFRELKGEFEGRVKELKGEFDKKLEEVEARVEPGVEWIEECKALGDRTYCSTPSYHIKKALISKSSFPMNALTHR